MKNLILVFAAIAISAGAYAQTDSTKTNQGDMNNKQKNVQNNPVDNSHPDAVITDSTNRKTNQGDMNNPNQNMQNKPVDKSYPKGDADSTKTKKSPKVMNNNQSQNMQNNLANNTNSGRVIDLPKSNQQNDSGDKSQPDGVMMQEGKLMKVKNGEMPVLQEKEITMSNGTKITSDGTYIKKDGTKMTLKEGQYMDMSGNIEPLETNKDKKIYLVPDSTIKRTNKL